MSDEDERPTKPAPDHDEGDTTDGPQDAQTRPPRLARHVQPLGPRVLVRVVKSEDRSAAGLFLPQGVKDESAAASLGEVVEVARTMPNQSESLVGAGDTDHDEDDHDEDGHMSGRADLGTNVSGVPLGAHVLFEKERGVAIPWDENLRLLEVRHVLAIVDIITEDKIQ